MFDIGEHEGERFLTMEFVEGQMLSARIDTGPSGVGRPLASALLLPVSQQICAGLSAAHAVGVIHRELLFVRLAAEKIPSRQSGNNRGTASAPWLERALAATAS